MIRVIRAMRFGEGVGGAVKGRVFLTFNEIFF